MFENGHFIKPDVEFKHDYSGRNYAPMFRRKFRVEHKGKAVLSVCGLGIAYYYINGRAISPDLFTAPVSDYNKILWYNEYDVSELLGDGANVISVICGNGWYNEDLKTGWDFNEAAWRDVPKFIMQLSIDGKTVMKSDEHWKCSTDGPVLYNNLRNGEIFDFNRYEKDWVNIDFDDSEWSDAVIDKTPPKGKFVLCECEPVRELASYDAKSVSCVSDNVYVFDIGKNISGYVRIKTRCEKGRHLIIRYAEDIDSKGQIWLNNMQRYTYEGRFMTDEIICSGEELEWSPKFAYHGFRYIEVMGLCNANEAEIRGIEVHQAIERKTEFECSNEFLNKLFAAGVNSSLSNMFYMITDCPTREKLGWANDAQASVEQLLTNFKTEKLFLKWLEDIKAAMRDDGAMPGIIPTAGWGFEFGNGPVSDGILFEIPYRIYLHTGNSEPLTGCIDRFEKYMNYLQGSKNDEGLIEFGLDDWENPTQNHIVTAGFINAFFEYKFYKIYALAVKLSGKDASSIEEKAERQKNFIIKSFSAPSGECVYNKQTAVVMMIYYGIYNDIEPLKSQLMRLLEASNFHHECGMVGMRRLLHALNKCGLEEYAYKVLCKKGKHTYSEWIDSGSETLWEFWHHERGNLESKNHHMYSDFMSWIIKTVCGISIDKKTPGELNFNISPYFFEDLTYAKCRYETNSGLIFVKWKKSDARHIELTIRIDGGVTAFYAGSRLKSGESVFLIEL